MRVWRQRAFDAGFFSRMRCRPKRKKQRRHSNVLFFIMIFLLMFYSFQVFDKRIKPTVISMSEARAEYIAAIAINKVVYELINEQNIGYDDLMTFQKDNNGQITALQANISRMNQLKSDIAIRVQQAIYNIDSTKIYVPLGNAINSSLFTGWGPKIPIQLTPIGSAETDFESGFQTAGINQTKHAIFLIVQSKVRIMLPVIETSATVKTKVPVAETIIVGTVPQHYINVEGQGLIPFPLQ